MWWCNAVVKKKVLCSCKEHNHKNTYFIQLSSSDFLLSTLNIRFHNTNLNLLFSLWQCFDKYLNHTSTASVSFIVLSLTPNIIICAHVLTTKSSVHIVGVTASYFLGLVSGCAYLWRGRWMQWWFWWWFWCLQCGLIKGRCDGGSLTLIGWTLIWFRFHVPTKKRVK